MSKVVLLAPTPPPIGGIAQWTYNRAKKLRKKCAKIVDESWRTRWYIIASIPWIF